MEWRRLRSLVLSTTTRRRGREDRVRSNTLNIPQWGMSLTMTFDAYKPVERVLAKQVAECLRIATLCASGGARLRPQTPLNQCLNFP